MFNELDIPKIKALCFDVDGTLSDTDDQFVLKIVRWLTPIKFLFPNKDPLPYARRFVMRTETPGNFLFGIPDRLGIDDEITSLGNYLYDKGIGRSDKPFLLISGVFEALATLSDHYPLSIVSARGERSTNIFLNQFGLNKFFQAVATAQTCEHTKPYPDPIHWAAEKMGVESKDCLMIGDTTVDILAARAAKAQSVGVLCGFGEEKELKNAGAHLIVEHTAYLPNVLIK